MTAKLQYGEFSIIHFSTTSKIEVFASLFLALFTLLSIPLVPLVILSVFHIILAVRRWKKFGKIDKTSFLLGAPYLLQSLIFGIYTVLHSCWAC